MKLKQLYPDANWISKRSLILEKFKDGILGKKGHIVAGILEFANGQKIAIEILLTIHNKKSLKKIMRWYLLQFAISEVWYYCPEKIAPALNKLATHLSLIKVKNLEELIL